MTKYSASENMGTSIHWHNNWFSRDPSLWKVWTGKIGFQQYLISQLPAVGVSEITKTKSDPYGSYF